MLATLLSKIFVGAFVGYTTNDMAIQMLFRKRFGLGGIFLKTTEEFVENISSVVERDVLNHHTLRDELNTEVFREEVEKTVRRYLEQQLFESVSPDLRLADVPGIDTTFEQLMDSFRAGLPKALNPFLNQLIGRFTVGDVATKPQLLHLSERVTELLLQKLEEYGVLQRFIQQFHQEFAETPPRELLTPEFIEEVSLHGAYVSEVLHQTLLDNHTDSLEQLIEKAYTELGFSQLIREAATSISQKSFNEIFGQETVYAITEQLLSDTQRIVSSEQGEQMLGEFADLLIDTLEQEEKTVFDLLSADIQQTIRVFFKEQFPPILDKLITWLYSKQSDIENLIDESFGRNVDGKFKAWLIQTFIGSVSQSANVIEKMVDIVRSYRENPERIARQLTQQIISYLNEQSIGSIVKNLREQRSLLRFSVVLQKNVSDALSRLEAKDFAHLFEKKLVNFFELDQIVRLVEQNIRLLIERQLKDRFLYSRRASLLLSSSFQNRLVQASEQPLGTLISANQAQIWSVQLEGWTLQVADRYQGTIEQVLYQNVALPLESRNWSSIVSGQQITNFTHFGNQALEEYLQAGFQRRKENKLHTYFKLINRIPDLHSNMGGVLRVALLENLETILDGRIKALVKSNLHRQSTAQIRDMVEKFMGQELKPITRLGALFGGIAGGVLAYLPSFQNLGLRWGVPSLAYGLTGLGTNWIALRMIFRPYTKKYLPVARLPIPLTPGVVVRRQQRFARRMGGFVSDKLMNAEGLRDSFDDKKPEILDFLTNLLRQNNYARVEDFVQRHKEALSEKVAQTSYQLLHENLHKIQERLVRALEDFRETTLSGADTAFLEDQILSFLRRQETIDLLVQELLSHWADLTQEQRSLEDLLPENAQERLIEVLLEAIRGESRQFADRLVRPGFVEDILKDLNQQAERYAETSLSELLNAEQQERVQEQFARYIYREMKSEQLRRQVLDFAIERIGKEVSPEKRIKDLFGGELLGFLERNLDFVIQKIFESGLIWMKNNGEVIADRIYERAFSEQRAALLYKDTIRNTVIELTNEGVPQFVEQERSSIRDLIGQEIERLGAFTIGSFDIHFEEPYIASVIDNLVTHPRTEESVQKLTVSLLRETFRLPLHELLPLNRFAELKQLQELLREELERSGARLQRNFKGSEDLLFSEIHRFLDALVREVLGKVTPEAILDGFSEERTEGALRQALHKAFESEAFETQLRQLLHKLIAQVKDLPLEEVADWKQFEKDLSVLVERMVKDPEQAIRFQEVLKKLVLHNMEALNRNISTETKEFLVHTLAESALDALGHRLPDLLASVNIHDIVVKELNNMSPENLEFLFKGFAKKYLDELVRYGFLFGILFGLGLDVVLTLILGLINRE